MVIKFDLESSNSLYFLFFGIIFPDSDDFFVLKLFESQKQSKL
jgi:hypothetical protein